MAEIWNMIQVALGIGLVIFVHEAGHFLAARWCKVKVETFSLGFGPKLFGWTRGETLYQIAAVPLGGYVKMAGEDIYDPDAPKNPGDLGSKSVPQRFLIYSGGVIMNMIFALVVFPIILMAGVPFAQPMLGTPNPGGPAWKAGLERGTVVKSVNGHSVYAFMHIPNTVALSSDSNLTLEIIPPGSDQVETVQLESIKNESLGMHTIGINASIDPDNKIYVQEGSRAEELGLATGDKLLEIIGMPEDYEFFEYMNVLQSLREPLHARFETASGEVKELTLEIEEPSDKASPAMGVRPAANIVHSVRGTSRTSDLRLEEDDVLITLGDRPIYDSTDLRSALAEAEGSVDFLLKRDGNEHRVALPAMELSERLALARDIALMASPKSQTIVVTPGSISDRTGIRSGDRIVDIDGEKIEGFAGIRKARKAASKGDRAMSITVLRDLDGDSEEEIRFTLTPEPLGQVHGIHFQQASYIYKADGPVEAMVVGFSSAWKFLQDTWLTLKGMFLGRVDTDQLGGIITIAVVANSMATAGLPKLFFFLCLLSVNLAFLNVLPIPVLDGGHLFFLLIEAVKGSPVSERVMSYSQLVGLVLIVSLMIYVIHNDLMRWVFPPT